MKILYYRLLLVLSFLVAASCSSRQMAIKLSDIESYIEEHPDSALTVLESLPNGDLNSKELRARYSLLYAMALDKNYIDTTDVSIIQPAVQYFKNHGSADEKMKAYYYQGIAYFNKEEYDNAIVSFSYAEEQIPDATDMRYVGLVYSRISDLYNRSRNTDDELKYVDLAADIFAKYGIEKYKYSTLLRKGEALMGVRKHNEAKDIFLLLLNNPGVSDNVKVCAKEDYALLLLTGADRNAKESLALFREVLAGSGRLRSTNYWGAYAYSLAACGYKKESDQLFSQLYALQSKDYSVVDAWKAAVCKEDGNYREALSLLENTLSHQDSLVRISISQATMRAQKDHLALKNTQLQIEDKNHQMRLMVVIFVLLFALIVLYLYYRMRNERLSKEREELSALNQEARHMLDIEKANVENVIGQLDEKEAALLSLRKQFASMYKAQYKVLNDLCAAYWSPMKKDKKDVIYDEVKRQVSVIANDEENQDRFISLVNASLDNIVDKLQQELPNHSTQDFRFLTYIIAGFDAKTIANLMDYSVGTVYTKKNRLKTEISGLSSPNREFYLDYID